MSLCKQKFLMFTPAETRVYTPGFHRNSRKTMRLPPLREMKSDALHCLQSNALFPIKQVRNLDLLDETAKSPREILHKSRRTLMSPQECEIAQCSPNQLQMITNSPALASEQSPVPLIQDKWLDFLWATPEIP